jgi:hypothetical protein
LGDGVLQYTPGLNPPAWPESVSPVLIRSVERVAGTTVELLQIKRDQVRPSEGRGKGGWRGVGPRPLYRRWGLLKV